MRGGALAVQGQGEAGIAHLRQGLAAWQAIGSQVGRTSYLTFLAEAYGHVGQTAAGLHVLAEALACAHTTGERCYEAELYRLKGELTLQQFKVQSSRFKVQGSRFKVPSTHHLAPTRRRKPKRVFTRPSRSLAGNRPNR